MDGTVLDQTYRLLDESDITLREIAVGADVNYWWLTKLKQRRFEEPGVKRIERLHRFLSQRSGSLSPKKERAAAAPQGTAA